MRILLQDISKVYQRRPVLQQMTLTVHQGEIVGLLGPNGAGKTTTFHIATGLTKPSQGKVWLGSREITALPLHQRARLGIGYLAQDASIFRHLSVRDNLLLVMEQSRVPRQQWYSRLANLLADFQLEQVADTLGMQVSGGERRRTELARVLATGREGPQFLLLDEPFAGIDPIAVADLQRMIDRLCDRNLGILITDHNVRETLAITDRTYILREGRILAAGTPSELYDNALVRQYYLGDRFRQ
ncbi:LPS export ABC transporter ATP-binding protein [Acaryochloris sp. IP29b_bin.148]|uniref:LPS export ABC transporter ATP-binding protein n=1 Tax=Acaryochloris sp. IP29b_bin.148 TaxID=2969218 RepID=UPI002626D265|nr:LPS export ABC transporter ATP-binding protein [Acaryochloris sp. IP29b_bin.148]